MDLTIFITAIFTSVLTFTACWLWLKRAPANITSQSSGHAISSPIGMAVTNPNLPNHPIVFCNDEFTQLSGYTRQELLGKPWDFLQQRDTQQSGIAALAAAIAEQRETCVTLRNYRRDGRLFWNKITITPMFDSNQKCSHFVWVQQDVTQSSSNESDLMVKNQRLSAIQSTLLELTQHNTPSFELLLEKYMTISAANLDVTRVGLWQVDANKDQLECRLMLHNGDVVNESWTMPIAQRPKYFSTLESNQLAIVNDTSEDAIQFDLSLEYIISRNVGAVLDAAVTINGRLVAIISHEHTDGSRHWSEDEQQSAITIADLCGVAFVSEENRIASQQLKTTEALLTEAQHIARLGSFIWYPASNELLLSHQHLASMVDTRAINTIEAFSQFALEPDREQFLADVKQTALHTTSNYQQTYGFSFEENKPCFLEFNIESYVVQLDSGETKQGIRGTIQDVTERTLAEQETKKLQVRLIEAEKLETIGTLAGGVAHDFNNLLTPVIGFAEILTNDFEEKDPRRNYSQQIARSGLRAKNLVEQLLTFSHHQPGDYERIDLVKVCTQSVADIQSIVSSTIAFDSEPLTTLAIAADPTQIHQVILNLSQNADAAMQGRGVIHIALEVQEAGADVTLPQKQYAIISVTDNGPGIDPIVKPHIFEPFFTTHELGQGPGLGLSVVHGIAQQHNGHIETISEPGQMVFKFYLPLS